MTLTLHTTAEELQPAAFQYGDFRVAVSSYAEASEAWLRHVEEARIKVSRMRHIPSVFDAEGNEIARLSYNGKVWPEGYGWHEDRITEPLYDPTTRKKEA